MIIRFCCVSLRRTNVLLMLWFVWVWVNEFTLLMFEVPEGTSFTVHYKFSPSIRVFFKYIDFWKYSSHCLKQVDCHFEYAECIEGSSSKFKEANGLLIFNGSSWMIIRFCCVSLRRTNVLLMLWFVWVNEFTLLMFEVPEGTSFTVDYKFSPSIRVFFKYIDFWKYSSHCLKQVDCHFE